MLPTYLLGTNREGEGASSRRGRGDGEVRDTDDTGAVWLSIHLLVPPSARLGRQEARYREAQTRRQMDVCRDSGPGVHAWVAAMPPAGDQLKFGSTLAMRLLPYWLGQIRQEADDGSFTAPKRAGLRASFRSRQI